MNHTSKDKKQLNNEWVTSEGAGETGGERAGGGGGGGGVAGGGGEGRERERGMSLMTLLQSCNQVFLHRLWSCVTSPGSKVHEARHSSDCYSPFLRSADFFIFFVSFVKWAEILPLRMQSYLLTESTLARRCCHTFNFDPDVVMEIEWRRRRRRKKGNSKFQ